MRLGRLLLSHGLALYAVVIRRAEDSWSLVDYVNLPIHETSHLVYSMCGEQITALGGTLFQLIVPLAFATGCSMQCVAQHQCTDLMGCTELCEHWPLHG